MPGEMLRETSMTTSLTIARPDDWHLHLRDGGMLSAVLPHTSRHFGRAIVMPNLVPPVVTVQDALAYRDRITAATPRGHDFTPLMTLYLTEETRLSDVAEGFEAGLISAVKLYPAGATTNSAQGVRDMTRVTGVLEKMADIGCPLCVHGEVTNPEIDIFDREAVFLETVLDPLRARLPDLRVVLEHVTTTQGVAYVTSAPKNLAATITTHHLIINRNHILAGGIRPHYYCLPVAKRESHRQSLRKAATGGDDRFFLGTDSAPHTDLLKENACGCAGVFSAPNTLACLAHVFEEENALDRLEAFCSLNGPAFYGLAASPQSITLTRGAPGHDPEKIATPDGPLSVFDPGFALCWRVSST